MKKELKNLAEKILVSTNEKRIHILLKIESKYFDVYQFTYEKIYQSYEETGKIPISLLVLDGLNMENFIEDEEDYEFAVNHYLKVCVQDEIQKHFRRLSTVSIETAESEIEVIKGKIERLEEKINPKVDKTYKQLLTETINEMKEIRESGEDNALHISHLPTFENATGGFLKGEMLFIYGREKSSKTTLATSIGLDYLSQGKKGLIFSLEMSEEVMAKKTLTMKTGIDFLKFRNPKTLTDSDLEIINKKVLNIEGFNLYIYDNIFNELGIYEKVKEHKPDFVIIDYLMLIDSTLKRQNLREELNYLTRYFKMKIAKELNTFVILISQSNAEGTRQAEGMGGMRDSDAFVYIEKAAGKIINEISYQDGDYLMHLKGFRYAIDGTSLPLRFINNDLQEITPDYNE